MSTTYLTRPVMDWPINWHSNPSAELAYALRTVHLGFAAPRHEQLQSATRAGFSGHVRLNDEADIVAWSEFMASISGRMAGFWVSMPLAEMQIDPESEASTTAFTVRDRSLVDYFDAHPHLHLCFTNRKGEQQFAKVSNVLRALNGQEQILLSSALATPIDSTWDVSRLVYCRMSSDDDETEYLADNVAQKTVKIVELTDEYQSVEEHAEIELGMVKVFLYEFKYQIGEYERVWRLTGLNQDITSGGDLFKSAPIEHSGHVRSMRTLSQTMNVSTWLDADNPLALFVPFKAPSNMTVKIMEITYDEPDEQKQLYFGRILGVEPEGKALRASCGSMIFDQKFPRFNVGPACNNCLFDEFCQASKAKFSATAQVVALSGRHMLVHVSNPPVLGITESVEMNWFAMGWLESGADETFEMAGIRQNAARNADTGNMQVHLSTPMRHAVVGTILTMFAGCDGSREMCDTKFQNFRHWGGHTIAQENSAIIPMDDSQTGGKKG